jgi:hypothetical protein
MQISFVQNIVLSGLVSFSQRLMFHVIHCNFCIFFLVVFLYFGHWSSLPFIVKKICYCFFQKSEDRLWVWCDQFKERRFPFLIRNVWNVRWSAIQWSRASTSMRVTVFVSKFNFNFSFDGIIFSLISLSISLYLLHLLILWKLNKTI